MISKKMTWISSCTAFLFQVGAKFCSYGMDFIEWKTIRLPALALKHKSKRNQLFTMEESCIFIGIADKNKQVTLD